MDINLKYRAWIGEKHADIAHKLMGNDIETFAIEFAEHLVKNCYIPPVRESLVNHLFNDSKVSQRLEESTIESILEYINSL